MKAALLIKTALDRGLALAAVLALFPIFLCAALVIKINSRGPIFFRQERIGRNGNPFQILKFRTMHLDAQTQHTGSVSTRNDPRVIRGGQLLRQSKVDELPQLLNVLGGTMSLVGPRPTVAEDFDRMTPAQRRRTDVLPGLTGLAQIRGNTSLSWPERIEYDLAYIDGYSLWLDFKILAETALRVITLRAATDTPGTDEWAAT
ncbi:MAG: sugar transferase [Planctomycetota bacterium]